LSSDRRKALVAMFRDGARQALSGLDRDLVSLEKSPGDSELGARVLRAVHTLKGDSKIAGFPLANRVAHRAEDVLVRARENGFELSAPAADLVLEGFDLVRKAIEQEPGSHEHEAEVEAYSARVDALLQAAARAAPPAPCAPAPSAQAAAPAPSQAQSQAPAAAAPAQTPAAPAQAAAAPAPAAPAPARSEPAEDFVRIGAQQLASLTSLSGSLSLRQQQLERILVDVEGWIAGQPQGDAGAQQKRAGAALASRARTESFELKLLLQRLQEEVEQMRLRRIGELFERFPRAVRDLARALGKEVRLELDGAEVTVDKQVLDQLDKVVLHLVRNSVDHGLEKPEERLAAGKPREGVLTLAARPVGGRVELTVSDDGRGLDPAKLRQVAVRRGLLDEAAAGALSEAEAMRLVFRAGFSTRDQVSEYSGRGVGLDVVQRQVEDLGGAVTCQSALGQGSSFTLTLPVSLALTHVLIVELGEELYALPATEVRGVARVDPSSVEPAGAGRSVRIGEERHPLASLAVLLDRPKLDSRGALQLVVLESAGRTLALEVSRIAGQRQTVTRALDPLLSGLRLIAGSVELEGGLRALQLSVPELLRLAAAGVSAAHANPGSARAEARKRVLIVDDSSFARDMLRYVLGRLGYAVSEARNGEEGWSQLLARPPDLVMTDLDMPVLDGFSLIERIRELPQLRDLPVVVLSTRGADADKRRAMQAGANAYLVKSSFEEAEISRTLRQLLR
jgi:chemotaxis protein histidine kinase CheA